MLALTPCSKCILKTHLSLFREEPINEQLGDIGMRSPIKESDSANLGPYNPSLLKVRGKKLPYWKTLSDGIIYVRAKFSVRHCYFV